MHAYTIALFLLASASWSVASAQTLRAREDVLGCVLAERLACGCYIRIKDLACPSRAMANEPHLFTGLDGKDPLLLQLGERDIELPHTRHNGSSVKGDKPGRWTDTYSSKDLSVRVTYAPGKRTCAKPDSEGCEYADYNATVVLQPRGEPERTFKATATCGC